uniref:Uncharacterized protein n=1 Tax=Oryza glaberrima TaxID=4538 RepID=I1QMJ5_ORYGL
MAKLPPAGSGGHRAEEMAAAREAEEVATAIDGHKAHPSTTRSALRAVPVHGLHLGSRHGPLAVGPCRAGPKARAAHRAFFEISLFYIPTLWVVPYNTFIFPLYSLFRIPELCTDPACRGSSQAQHGCRARPCLGRTKSRGHRASDHMAIYSAGTKLKTGVVPVLTVHSVIFHNRLTRINPADDEEEDELWPRTWRAHRTLRRWGQSM